MLLFMIYNKYHYPKHAMYFFVIDLFRNIYYYHYIYILYIVLVKLTIEVNHFL